MALYRQRAQPNVRILDGEYNTAKRGYFLPLKYEEPTMRIVVDEFQLEPDDTFVLNNGQVLKYDNYNGDFHKALLKYDVGFDKSDDFDEHEFEFEKLSLPFNYNGQNELVFNSDLSVCYGFHFDIESIQCSVFQSDGSLFDTTPEKVCHYEHCYTLHAPKSSKLLHLNVSNQSNFLVVIYRNGSNFFGEFIQITEHTSGGIFLTFHSQIDLSFLKPVQSTNYWFTELFCEKSICLIYTDSGAVVYSLESQSSEKFPQEVDRHLPRHHAVCYDGDVLIFRGTNIQENGQSYAKIEIFKLDDMHLQMIKLLKLHNHNIRYLSDFLIRASPSIKIVLAGDESVYVLDPFKDAVLQTFRLQGDVHAIEGIKSNVFANELYVWHMDNELEGMVLTLIDLDNQEEMSLKYLAKRAILSFFTINQLKTLNVPKTLKVVLGVI